MRGTVHAESTFGSLRYFLGGDRPSQTTHLTLSEYRVTAPVRLQTKQEWYSNVDSTEPSGPVSKSPTYAIQA